MRPEYPSIPPSPTLQELQVYQAAICKLRGWDQTSDLATFLLFAEEVGERSKAIRYRFILYLEKVKLVDPVELK